MDNVNPEIPFRLHPPDPSRRCQAKSKRSGEQCKNWAMKEKNVCKFHGGRSAGPRTAAGLENSRMARLTHGRDSLEILKIRQIERVLAVAAGLIEMLKIFSSGYIERKIESMGYAEYRTARPAFTAFCRGEIGIFELITVLDGKKPKIPKPKERNPDYEDTII